MGQLPAKLNAAQCIKQFMRETRAVGIPDRGLVYASESLNLAGTPGFDYRTLMEQEFFFA